MNFGPESINKKYWKYGHKKIKKRFVSLFFSWPTHWFPSLSYLSSYLFTHCVTLGPLRLFIWTEKVILSFFFVTLKVLVSYFSSFCVLNGKFMISDEWWPVSRLTFISLSLNEPVMFMQFIYMDRGGHFTHVRT